MKETFGIIEEMKRGIDDYAVAGALGAITDVWGNLGFHMLGSVAVAWEFKLKCCADGWLLFGALHTMLAKHKTLQAFG